jgi:hypothetical protein
LDFVTSAYLQGPNLGGLLSVVLHEAVFVGAVWVLLKLRHHPERWLQSITALSAASVLLGLVLLPVLPKLAELVEFARLAFETLQRGEVLHEVPAMPLRWLAWLFFIIAVWKLLVMAQVLRHAMELSFAWCVVIGFFTVISVSIVEGVFISFLSAPVAT